MSDTKNSMPAQPKTTEMPAVTVPTSQLDALILEVRAGREEQRASTAELTEKVDMLSVNVENLQHDAKDTRLRLGRMERELDEVKDRQANNSVRAKEPSQHDVEIRAELSDERKAREALATKVDSIEAKTDAQTKMLETISTSVVDSVKGFWKRNPKLETALAGLILAVLAYAYTALTRGQLP